MYGILRYRSTDVCTFTPRRRHLFPFYANHEWILLYRNYLPVKTLSWSEGSVFPEIWDRVKKRVNKQEFIYSHFFVPLHIVTQVSLSKRTIRFVFGRQTLYRCKLVISEKLYRRIPEGLILCFSQVQWQDFLYKPFLQNVEYLTIRSFGQNIV